MSLSIVFFDVGNADCIVIWPGQETASVVDLPRWRQLERWLKNKGVKEIFDVFITHEHRDHLEPIEELIGFVEEWLKQGTGRRIGRLIMSQNAYGAAIGRLRATPPNTPEYHRRKALLERLQSLYNRGDLEVQQLAASKDPIRRPGFDVTILHPNTYFEPVRSNEACLVLRVTHGSFSATLLGDLEGAGLVECAKLAQLRPEAFKSKVVKIPHHGAWPADTAALESLLRSIAAERAVLSVGSKNPYGHVAPELFQLLLSLSGGGERGRFICTQQTRTCTERAAQRKALGKKGLDKALPCAGEITITAEEDGSFRVEPEHDHEKITSKVPYAACLGRMEP